MVFLWLIRKSLLQTRVAKRLVLCFRACYIAPHSPKFMAADYTDLRVLRNPRPNRVIPYRIPRVTAVQVAVEYVKVTIQIFSEKDGRMSSEAGGMNGMPIGKETLDRVSVVREPEHLTAFRSFIPASVRLRELTPLPLIVGTLLGIVFGASSLYLVLKVGLTVSASIPVAVISITVFRVLSKLGMRDATILEHNIVQTAGSAGESIAFGIGVTMPAILLLGFDLDVTGCVVFAVLDGC